MIQRMFPLPLLLPAHALVLPSHLPAAAIGAARRCASPASLVTKDDDVPSREHWFKLMAALGRKPETIEFEDSMGAIAELYEVSEVPFSVGDVVSAAGENMGSAKLFSFGKMAKLDEKKTLHLFGKYYRDDVLQHPDATDHPNIRAFMKVTAEHRIWPVCRARCRARPVRFVYPPGARLSLDLRSIPAAGRLELGPVPRRLCAEAEDRRAGRAPQILGRSRD